MGILDKFNSVEQKELDERLKKAKSFVGSKDVQESTQKKNVVESKKIKEEENSSQKKSKETEIVIENENDIFIKEVLNEYAVNQRKKRLLSIDEGFFKIMKKERLNDIPVSTIVHIALKLFLESDEKKILLNTLKKHK